MSPKGKVAIATGGNSGIGRAISLGLAKAGASIAIDYVAHPEATGELERANVVVFLAGDGASYLTATTIFADGGIMQSSGGL